MKKHLFTILIGAASMVASRPSRAQSIVATHDAYGHTVWVASDEAKPQPKPQSQQPETNPVAQQPASNQETSSRYSGLVYWSNKEHRWKPVPLASSATMKAARRAAQEVNDMVTVPMSQSESRALKHAQPVNLGSDNMTQIRPID